LTTVARFYAIGYLGQQMRLAFPFSVRDLILTGRAGQILFTPRAEDERSVHQAIDEVGIGELASRLAMEISGGELQLVRIAQLLAQDAPLLLLDESITHLDIAHQVKIIKLLQNIVTKGKNSCGSLA
jgi:iron complex transport system ATP-binding protein